MNPITQNIEAYYGNTYGLVYLWNNSDGSPFDLASNFTTISWKIFTKNNENDPIIELTVGSGLTISSTNRLVGEITAAQNETLFGSPIKYYQLTVNYGDIETILKGIYVVNRAQSGSSTENTNTLTVSLAPLEVSLELANNATNAFLALDAKNEAEASATAASTSATNSSNSATASANSATASEQSNVESNLWAQGTVAAVEAEFGVGNKSSKSWSEVAETQANLLTGALSILSIEDDFIEFVAIGATTITPVNETLTGATGATLTVPVLDVSPYMIA